MHETPQPGQPETSTPAADRRAQQRAAADAAGADGPGASAAGTDGPGASAAGAPDTNAGEARVDQAQTWTQTSYPGWSWSPQWGWVPTQPAWPQWQGYGWSPRSRSRLGHRMGERTAGRGGGEVLGVRRRPRRRLPRDAARASGRCSRCCWSSSLLLLPHFITLAALSIAQFVAFFCAQTAIVFTCRYPKGLHWFVGGVVRWQARVLAYIAGLTDRYPPFNLNDHRTTPYAVDVLLKRPQRSSRLWAINVLLFIGLDRDLRRRDCGGMAHRASSRP